MMAIKERNFQPLPDDLSLEVLVPKDNFYRRLEERIDLSFVRELVLPLYARGGRHSHPHTILGERRLLRALGIDITPAMSSEEAQDILEKDNDFDLIITDVYRVGRDEGVDFVVKLHKNKDERIGSLPVIFYAAYRWGDLVKRTLPARELRPEVEISNAVDEFIPKVIRRLSEERINPIIVSSKKIPATPEEQAAADRGFSE